MTRRASAIERAIAQTERHIDRLDALGGRAAWHVTNATSPAWRDQWLAALGTFSQRRQNAVYLLSGLKAIRHRPELQDRHRVMLRVNLRTDRRKQG